METQIQLLCIGGLFGFFVGMITMVTGAMVTGAMLVLLEAQNERRNN